MPKRTSNSLSLPRIASKVSSLAQTTWTSLALLSRPLQKFPQAKRKASTAKSLSGTCLACSGARTKTDEVHCVWTTLPNVRVAKGASPRMAFKWSAM
eukprot:2728965-Alexandrium_andersonii.AAC.1